MIMLSLYHLTTTFFLLILVTIPSSNSFLFEGESINCEGTYNCGSIHGVKYPFWGGGVRSRLCGRDDYLLECKNNVSSTLPAHYIFRKHTNGYQPSKFRVLTINESSTRMRIVHDKLWHNVCLKSPSFFNLKEYSTTLINGLRYVPGTRFINIYYGCNPEVLSHVQLPSNINCSVRGTTSTGVFFADEIVGNYVRGCSFSIVVPLVPTAYQQLWDTTLRLQEAVNEGFEVDYSDASGGCLACQDSGGICEFDQAFRCRCGDTVLPFTCPTNGKPALMQPNTNFARKIHLLKLATGVSVAGIGMLMCFGIWYTQYRKSFYKCIRLIKGKTEDQSLEGLLKQYGSLAPKRYSYWEIKKMTSGFKDKLGEGGYGGVYKGELFDGRVVAVKILKASKGDGEEFINEVASITQTSHVNVVSLLGYCLDGSKRALIYDFMPNGSLEKYIYGDGSLLGLQKLYQIAVGIAKGLEYLHRGCNTRILHFDIKPHNILLDEEFCPKISDFGLAKLCTRKESVISMLGARGTIGYIAPELISRSFGGVSHKSDVYSYGMMVLEMVGGRKNVNEKVSHASEIYFPYWAYQHVQLDDDLKLRGIINKEEEVTARKMILVGLWCIQTDPAQRSSMSKVIDMLEGSLILEIPPKPLLCTPYCSGRHSLTIQGLPLKASLISPSSSSLCSPEASAIS